MMVSSLAPWERSAAMSCAGIPTRPNPPTAMEEPSGISATASSTEAMTLFNMALDYVWFTDSTRVQNANIIGYTKETWAT